MKKYLILLIIPLLFFSIGCSDDESVIDDPFSEYPDLILGHWGYISDVQTITKTYNNSDLNEETTTYSGNYPVINESGTGMMYLTFFDNFQVNQSEYLLSSNDEVIFFEESILIDYSIEGDVISIPNFFPGVSDDGFINQLTETNLEIQWEWNSVGIDQIISFDLEGNLISTDEEYSENIVRVVSMYKVSELPQ